METIRNIVEHWYLTTPTGQLNLAEIVGRTRCSRLLQQNIVQYRIRSCEIMKQ
jgi:hypothetical protein